MGFNGVLSYLTVANVRAMTYFVCELACFLLLFMAYFFLGASKFKHVATVLFIFFV